MTIRVTHASLFLSRTALGISCSVTNAGYLSRAMNDRRPLALSLFVSCCKNFFCFSLLPIGPQVLHLACCPLLLSRVCAVRIFTFVQRFGTPTLRRMKKTSFRMLHRSSSSFPTQNGQHTKGPGASFSSCLMLILFHFCEK